MCRRLRPTSSNPKPLRRNEQHSVLAHETTSMPSPTTSGFQFLTTTTPPASERSRRSGPIVLVLALCGTTVSLMQTLVVPLLPDFPRLLGHHLGQRRVAGDGHAADQRRRDADLVAPRGHARQASDDRGRTGRPPRWAPCSVRRAIHWLC